MTFYGLERPVDYGRQQIFDPTTANMVLQAQAAYANALQKEYERALADQKEFQEKYGSFYSPILKDQAWVKENFNDPVRIAVNAMYDQGVNPLTNPQARAELDRIVRNLPYQEFAFKKERAALAKEYYKNKAKMQAEGKYNEAFSRANREEPDQWADDFVGVGSPTQYQDLNQFTSHIFDKIEDSYIDTIGEYDYYGVSPEAMAQALTPETLGGLLNSNLGRFHLQNAKNDLIRKGILDPTEQEVIQQFRDNVIAANNEKVHKNRKLNELYKMQQQHQYDMAEANARAGNGRGNGSGSGIGNNTQWSFAEVVRRNAATSIMGQQIQEYSDKTLEGLRDNQIEFGSKVSDMTGGHSFKKNGLKAFEDKYGSNRYSENDIANFLRYKVTDERTKSMVLPKQQIGRLYDNEDVISHTTGFRGAAYNTNRKWLEDADVVTITPTQRSYGAFMKDARHKNYFEMEVQTYKKETSVDSKGQPVEKLVPKKKRIMKFDSHITSVKNDPRTGYLGTVNKKGQVTNTPGMKVVNTQDHSYQDAVQGDKVATDAIIKGTIYGSDAIPSELPNYGQ